MQFFLLRPVGEIDVKDVLVIYDIIIFLIIIIIEYFNECVEGVHIGFRNIETGIERVSGRGGVLSKGKWRMIKEFIRILEEYHIPVHKYHFLHTIKGEETEFCHARMHGFALVGDKIALGIGGVREGDWLNLKNNGSICFANNVAVDFGYIRGDHNDHRNVWVSYHIVRKEHCRKSRHEIIGGEERYIRPLQHFVFLFFSCHLLLLPLLFRSFFHQASA